MKTPFLLTVVRRLATLHDPHRPVATSAVFFTASWLLGVWLVLGVPLAAISQEPFPPGSFSPRVEFSASSPAGIAVGDVDGDGRADVVSPILFGVGVQVFRNTTPLGATNISFAAPVFVSSGDFAFSAEIGDLDRDGKADVAVSIAGGVSLLRNTSPEPGTIAFAPHVDFVVGSPSLPNAVALADFDRDGRLDLAFLNHDDNMVRVYRNLSLPGSITSASFESTDDYFAVDPDFVMAGDLTGDGAVELVFTTSGRFTVVSNTAATDSILLGRDRSFRVNLPGDPPIPVGEIYAGAIADFDRDGTNDVVFANYDGGNLSVRRNVSVTSFAFEEEVLIPTGDRPGDLAVADFDADGRPDLAVVNEFGNTVSLHRNLSVPGTLTTNSFAPQLDLPTAIQPFAIAVADFNGDSKPDLVVANVNAGSISVFRNTINYPPRANPQTITFAEDTAAAVQLTGFDPEQSTLSYTIVSGPANGVLTGNPPNLIYHPITNYFGPDGFTFKVNDGQFDSSLARVDFIVLSVNDPPIADASATSPLLYIAPNNSNVTVVLNGSLSHDIDSTELQDVWLEGSVPLATGVVAVGSLPIGSHSVALVVSDGEAFDTNVVTLEVISIAQLVESLIEIAASDAPRPTPLIATLSAAIASIDRSHPATAINQLQAFQNQVRAQVLPLDATLADLFIQQAQEVIDLLAGPAAPRAALKISAVARQANDRFRLRFPATRGPVYVIEASTDLVRWEKIGVAKEGGAGSYIFDVANSTGRRFYRVVVP